MSALPVASPLDIAYSFENDTETQTALPESYAHLSSGFVEWYFKRLLKLHLPADTKVAKRDPEDRRITFGAVVLERLREFEGMNQAIREYNQKHTLSRSCTFGIFPNMKYAQRVSVADKKSITDTTTEGGVSVETQGGEETPTGSVSYKRVSVRDAKLLFEKSGRSATHLNLNATGSTSAQSDTPDSRGSARTHTHTYTQENFEGLMHELLESVLAADKAHTDTHTHTPTHKGLRHRASTAATHTPTDTHSDIESDTEHMSPPHTTPPVENAVSHVSVFPRPDFTSILQKIEETIEEHIEDEKRTADNAKWRAHIDVLKRELESIGIDLETPHARVHAQGDTHTHTHLDECLRLEQAMFEAGVWGGCVVGGEGVGEEGCVSDSISEGCSESSSSSDCELQYLDELVSILEEQIDVKQVHVKHQQSAHHSNQRSHLSKLMTQVDMWRNSLQLPHLVYVCVSVCVLGFAVAHRRSVRV